MITKPLRCRFRAAFALFWLVASMFIASLAAAAVAAEVRQPEATLHYHFRPIVTFRATFVGASPEYRAARSRASMPCRRRRCSSRSS